jgi:hypothetical protein
MDGMPPHIRHRPDRVYAKIHTKDVDERSLNFYGLPWSKMKVSAFLCGTSEANTNVFMTG